MFSFSSGMIIRGVEVGVLYVCVGECCVWKGDFSKSWVQIDHCLGTAGNKHNLP